MAVNSLNSASKLRMVGLTSGMDTDEIVKQSLRFHQLRLDAQFRARTLLEWKQQALNTIKDDLNDFKRSYLTALGANPMRLSSTYNSTVATLSGKNKDAVTVATTISSQVGTVKIGQVVSLAKSTSVSTVGQASRTGDGFRLTDKLGSIAFAKGEVNWDANGEARLNINGADIVLKKSEMSSDDAVNDYFSGLESNADDIRLRLAALDESDPKYTEKRNAIQADPKYRDYLAYSVKDNSVYQDDSKQLLYINSKITAQGGEAIIFGPSDSVPATINGKPITIDKADTADIFSIDDIFDKANAVDRWLNFTYDKTDSSSIGRMYVTLNDTTIELTSDMTIQQMMDTINSSGAGVTMKYDRLSDQFTVESNKAGDNPMRVWGLWGLGIANGTHNNGSMAQVYINDELVSRDTNTFEYRGLRITLNNTTKGSGTNETWNSSEDNITVGLKRDATGPIEKIRTYIDAYNTLIKKLEDLLNERKTTKERSYTPLTDEEKASMTEKQVAEWEAIAKKALLRNDSSLQSLTNSLRNALFQQIEAAGLSPSQIGLTTGNYFTGMGGQIQLDENQLKEALESDPERVMRLFMGGTEADYTGAKGLMWQVDELMTGYINGGQRRSLTNLEDSIRRANDQMEKAQQKMYDEEDRLYKKYAAMETALSKIQQQTDWMTAMLGASNK